MSDDVYWPANSLWGVLSVEHYEARKTVVFAGIVYLQSLPFVV